MASRPRAHGQPPIAIVGAGPVGGLLACLLDDHALPVVLLGPAASTEPLPAAFDLRTYALTAASCQALRHAGIWSGLVHERVTPFAAMEIYDGASFGSVRFEPPVGWPHVGVLVEHANLARALELELERRPAIRRESARLIGFSEDGDRCHLRLDDGSTVAATTLFGCDGGHSSVRDLAAIGVDEEDFDQQAIVCNVGCAVAHQQIARQRFLDTGPLAFLPLPGGHDCAIVWSVRNDYADRLMALAGPAFEYELAAAFEQRLGAVRLLSERRAFPLRALHAASYVAGRVALVGDAAHVIHPLAGQGLNLGLMDAAVLAEIVATVDAAGRPIGHSALRRYERRRRGENLALMRLTAGLNRLFGTSATPLRWTRGAGMRLTDRSGPLKRYLIERAMGLRGDLAEVARPPVVSDAIQWR